MLELWKKQLTTKKFAVEHGNPSVFVTSQWQEKSGPDLFYLMYRWLIALFFLVSLILSIVDLRHPDISGGSRAKWLIYLTNWGFTVCSIQSIISVVMLTGWLFKRRKRDAEVDVDENVWALRLYKVYWVINTIATDTAFSITIIYWSLIYDETKMALDAMNIIIHVINSVLMLIDLCIVAHPIKILHFYWSVLFGFCYVAFSIFYYLAGGTSREDTIYIYPILDWSKPGKTVVVCLLVMIFVIFLHVFVYGVYRLRKSVHARLNIVNKDMEESKKQSKQESYNNPVMTSDIV